MNVYRQLAAVIRERDALAGALIQIKDYARTYNQPDRRDLYKWINELGRIAETALESVKPPR